MPILAQPLGQISPRPYIPTFLGNSWTVGDHRALPNLSVGTNTVVGKQDFTVDVVYVPEATSAILRTIRHGADDTKVNTWFHSASGLPMR
jgi:hypothetical protein